jgi:hypothetical protein
LGFKVDRAEIVKTGVESEAVVEGLNVVKDGGPSLGAGGEAVMIDQFVFESAPEGFDKGVIVAVALAAHGRDLETKGSAPVPSVPGTLTYEVPLAK